jgi:hypothetical protein
MPHPLVSLYDSQIATYALAVDNCVKGIERLRKRGDPDTSKGMIQTTEAHAIACVKLANLKRERESLMRDLDSLDRLREMSKFFMSWRDSLEQDAKNPKLPDAQRHFSAATAARINVLLMGGRV